MNETPDLNTLKNLQNELTEMMGPQPERTPEEIAEEKAKATENLKKMYREHFRIEDVDIDAELELIKQKKSKLSRSRREAVLSYKLMFDIAPKLKEKEKELEKLDQNAELPIDPENVLKEQETN